MKRRKSMKSEVGMEQETIAISKSLLGELQDFIQTYREIRDMTLEEEINTQYLLEELEKAEQKA